MEPAYYDNQRQRSDVKLVIKAAVLNDDLSLKVQCQITQERLRLFETITPEIFKDLHRHEFIFYPDTDTKGHETIIKLLKYHQLSRRLENQTNFLLRQTLFDKMTEKPTGEKRTTIAFPAKTIQLHKEQGQVFKAMKDVTYPIIFQQAPTGTGKNVDGHCSYLAVAPDMQTARRHYSGNCDY